jgi:hypothetical protein
MFWGSLRGGYLAYPYPLSNGEYFAVPVWFAVAIVVIPVSAVALVICLVPRKKKRDRE